MKPYRLLSTFVECFERVLRIDLPLRSRFHRPLDLSYQTPPPARCLQQRIQQPSCLLHHFLAIQRKNSPDCRYFCMVHFECRESPWISRKSHGQSVAACLASEPGAKVHILVVLNLVILLVVCIVYHRSCRWISLRQQVGLEDQPGKKTHPSCRHLQSRSLRDYHLD